MHGTSVAICTWNRADSLRATLQSLAAMRRPPEISWELLVVNNACTDHTDQVVAEFTAVLPVRGLHEPKPGLSNARNCAVDAAKGDYLIWTDDDVSVASNWLESYAAAFAAHPDASVFGGTVTPVFEGDPPAWLRRQQALVANVYAQRDFGERPFELDIANGRLPFGANYALRMDAQRRHRYDPNLGFCQGRLKAGEETAVILQLLAEGAAGWWVPEARVAHRIEPFRQTLGYIHQYHHDQGMRAAEQELPAGQTCPRWLYRMWLQRWAGYRIKRLLGREPDWVVDFIEAARCAGMLNYCRR